MICKPGGDFCEPTLSFAGANNKGGATQFFGWEGKDVMGCRPAVAIIVAVLLAS